MLSFCSYLGWGGIVFQISLLGITRLLSLIRIIPLSFPSVAPKDKGSNRKQRRVGDVASHIQIYTNNKTQTKRTAAPPQKKIKK